MAAETAWKRFFEDAGLPPKIASKYSSLFVEHRIQRSMLTDLTKSILNEVGITAVGDVLAILKQAKIVTNTDEAEAKESPLRTPLPKEKPIVSNKPAVVATSKAPVSIKARIGNPAIPIKRPRIQQSPDHDVQYRVKMPLGTTERSRQLLTKAAAVQQKAKQGSIFERLGAKVNVTFPEPDEEMDDSGYLSSVPSRLRKAVSFASGTKESSPEVTSTTDEYFGKLESDRMARKQSALMRLGSRRINEVVQVTGGERKLLVAKRSLTEKKSIFDLDEKSIFGVEKKSIFDRLG